MFTKPLECCFDDTLESWETYIVSVRTQDIELDFLSLQFWPYDSSVSDKTLDFRVENTVNQDSEDFPSLQECVEEYIELSFNVRNFVLCSRGRSHFMKGQLSAVVFNCYPENTFMIATPNRVVNFKGRGAKDLSRILLSLRCSQQTVTLDKIFYMCTDIGEVDDDETEFLLAITPSNVSIISLYRSRLTRSLPFTKIKSFQRNSVYPDTVTLDIGRMKHGNRTYSFRSENVQKFVCCVRGQIEIIANLVEVKRQATNAQITQTRSEENYSKKAPPQHVYADVCDQPDKSEQGQYDYENFDSNSAQNSDNASSSEFLSFPDSIEYEEPGTSTLSSSVKYDLPCDSSTEFSSYCTDIYPFFNNSFDSKEFVYEISGLDSDRRASAPEANVIYQDVDSEFYPSRESFVRRRLRRSYKYTKPTFISYIEGGSQALKSVCGGRNRYFSEPDQSSLELEGSRVYSKLFDPELLELARDRAEKTAEDDTRYDVLDRDMGTKLVRPHSSFV